MLYPLGPKIESFKLPQGGGKRVLQLVSSILRYSLEVSCSECGFLPLSPLPGGSAEVFLLLPGYGSVWVFIIVFFSLNSFQIVFRNPITPFSENKERLSVMVASLWGVTPSVNAIFTGLHLQEVRKRSFYL